MRKKMIRKLTALDCVKESGCQDFEAAFPRVTGYISECAKYDPDALYTATEVAELMEYLFELRRRKKDPGRVEPSEVQVTKNYYNLSIREKGGKINARFEIQHHPDSGCASCGREMAQGAEPD
ncbi:hypothetical protein K360107B91_15520 [Enterocloster bolteae]